ncbi:MAG: hypothetical protein AAF676_15085 [Pseudomonadota bacterium]
MIPELARLLVLNDQASPFGVRLNPALAEAIRDRLGPMNAAAVPIPVRAASSGPVRQSATPEALARSGIVSLESRRAAPEPAARAKHGGQRPE